MIYVPRTINTINSTVLLFPVQDNNSSIVLLIVQYRVVLGFSGHHGQRFSRTTTHNMTGTLLHRYEPHNLTRLGRIKEALL